MPTNRPMITIHNQETDEVITREMNDEEFENHQANLAKDAEEAAEIQAAATAKAALLARLGLTADEANLLIK
jgi:PDZ domain-containing secreted protein